MYVVLCSWSACASASLYVYGYLTLTSRVSPRGLFQFKLLSFTRVPLPQVRDRLLAVERHREALVASLQDGAGGPTALVTPAGREFAARFRLMAEEAVLCECKAVHGKRMGQLYLTCK